MSAERMAYLGAFVAAASWAAISAAFLLMAPQEGDRGAAWFWAAVYAAASLVADLCFLGLF